MSNLDDPRVYFAAERTALAWNRTALTLMAFGFAIERFGLFMRMLMEKNVSAEQMEHIVHSGASFWFGLAFIALGCFFSFTSAIEYRNVLKSLKPVEFPPHANPHLAFALNALIGAMAVTMIAYLVVSNLF